MRLFTALCVSALMVVSANADVTVNYGWEDGQTALGTYGSVGGMENVTGTQVGMAGANPDYTCPGANTGDYYLKAWEAPHDGTPQVLIAFVEGLTDGDVIDASFFGYDVTSQSPSLRIWAHYGHSGDVNSYAGSASGPSSYSDDSGWNSLSHSWTFDSDSGSRDALIVEARLYSYPSSGDARSDYFIDDLTVSVDKINNDMYSVTTPGGTTVVPEPASLVLLALGGLAVIRRR